MSSFAPLMLQDRSRWPTIRRDAKTIREILYGVDREEQDRSGAA
jgi:hypothetical protein